MTAYGDQDPARNENTITGNFRGIQGAGNEQLVAARALKHGFIVFFKLWSDAKYDMVIDCERILFRVQVKGTKTGHLTLSTIQRGGEDASHRRPNRNYTREDCDVVIGVDSNNGDCYILPIDYVMALGRSSANFSNLQNFRERWDFISGNHYLTIEQNRDGQLSVSELRNRVGQILPSQSLPSDLNQLRMLFYSNCPRPAVATEEAEEE
jgi:hypothetical protein